MVNAELVVHEFEVGRRMYRARLHEYRGTTYVDLREFFEPSPGAEPVPTKKGVSVPAEYLDELQTCIDALKAAASGTGARKSARRAA